MSSLDQFYKNAYDAGARQAMIDAGLVKVAQGPTRAALKEKEEELPFEETLKSKDHIPVPKPIAYAPRNSLRVQEQIPGARNIEVTRRANLGDGDFHGETNLINFDEALRNTDPGAYGEFARINSHREHGLGEAELGGRKYAPAATTRTEHVDGFIPRSRTPENLRERRIKEQPSGREYDVWSPYQRDLNRDAKKLMEEGRKEDSMNADRRLSERLRSGEGDPGLGVYDTSRRMSMTDKDHAAARNTERGGGG